MYFNIDMGEDLWRKGAASITGSKLTINTCTGHQVGVQESAPPQISVLPRYSVTEGREIYTQ